VNRNEMPRILFSAFAPRPQGGKRIHSVMIWKVEKMEDETIRLHTWETNSGSTPQEIASNYIEVLPDGEMYYRPWYDVHVDYSKEHPHVAVHRDAGRVAQLREVKEDRIETARFAEKLRTYCEAHPGECV